MKGLITRYSLSLGFLKALFLIKLFYLTWLRYRYVDRERQKIIDSLFPLQMFQMFKMVGGWAGTKPGARCSAGLPCGWQGHNNLTLTYHLLPPRMGVSRKWDQKQM